MTAPLAFKPGDPQWTALRHRCQHDLYYFASAILGYGELVPMTEGAHVLLCRFMEKRTGVEALDTAKYRKIELARGWGKSTVMRAYAMQRILQDPNTAILIANEKEQTAVDFLAEIKAHFETNQFLRALFPELIPTDFKETTWSATRIIVNRPNPRPEPTISVIGVGGTVTGSHPDIVFVDDAISRAAMENARAGSWDIMHQTNRWIHQLVPLLNPNAKPFPEIIFIGTRWWYGDCYEHIEEHFGYGERPTKYALRLKLPTGEVQQLVVFRIGDLAVFRRPAIEDGRSAFPEKWSLDDLAKIRVGDEVLFSCFPPDQPVVTERGDIPIADVKVGDLVYGLDGHWTPVRTVLVQPSLHPVCAIRAWGTAHTIHPTFDHHIFATRALRYRSALVSPANAHLLQTGSGNLVTRVLTAPEWLEAGTLAPGDILWGRINRDEQWPADWPEELRHPDVWFLVGHWIGDGSLSTNKRYPDHHSVNHSFDPRDLPLVNRVQGILLGLGRKARIFRKQAVLSIAYGHKRLGALFKSTKISPKRGQKLLPLWVERIPLPCQQALVDGYWSADGMQLRNGSQVVSVCHPLLEQMQRILARLGHASYIARTGVNHIRGCRIRGEGHPTQQLYALTRYDKLSRNITRKVWIDGDWICRRIRSVGESAYRGPVFTLEAGGSYTIRGNILVENCNYLLSPSDNLTATFKEGWLHYFDWLDERTVQYPDASGAKKIARTQDLDTLIFVDPGGFTQRTADMRARAAICVTGSTGKGEHLLLEAYSEPDTFLAAIRKVVEFCTRYSPRKLVVELAGQQAAFIEILRKALTEHSLMVTLEPVTPGMRQKEQRILQLEPWFQRGHIFIGRTAAYHEFRTQYSQFPRAARFDLLDALSYAPAVWKKQPGAAQQSPEERRAQELSIYRQRRGLRA